MEKTNNKELLEKGEEILRGARKTLGDSGMFIGVESYRQLLEHYEQLLGEARKLASTQPPAAKVKEKDKEIARAATSGIKEKVKINTKELNGSPLSVESVSFAQFNKSFPDNDSCFRYLARLKWSVGFTCRKCGYMKYCDGFSPYSRRCTRCTYHESATAFTLFHKCKFDVAKAFYIVFLIVATEGAISSYELSAKLLLEQKTCWKFRQKLLAVMKEKEEKGKKEKGWEYLIPE